MGAIKVGIIALAAMIITVLMGYFLIPLLKKLKFGQTILEIGPRWHKDKQGTPTMGGFLFIIGTIAGAVMGLSLIHFSKDNEILRVVGTKNHNILYAGMVMALAFAAVGFLDDYIKVSKKENEGLNERQKLFFQFIISAGYLLILYIIGERSTIVWLPFIGYWEMGLLYYPLMAVGIMFIINAVNLTDGIDGLCSSVTFIIAASLLIVSNLLMYNTMEVLSAAVAGACLGFAYWNVYPAKVFMGDTGSFFLGGIVVAIIFGLGIPAIIIFMGFIYIVEGFSVMIQTAYFKYTRRKTGTGKRLFKMTPIHHHFEMSGWKENKIVLVFTLIQLLMCAVGVYAITTM